MNISLPYGNTRYTGCYLCTPQLRGAQRGEKPASAREPLLKANITIALPEEGICDDIPFSLVLRPPYRLSIEEMGIKIRYLAGYSTGKVPPDLASACLELAAWNITCYRGRRIGVTGNVRGNGKDGEHLEASMPENVQLHWEPYRRRTI